MAVRIQQTHRRRRRATAEHVELDLVGVDSSALLEAVEQVVDLIDEATS